MLQLVEQTQCCLRGLVPLDDGLGDLKRQVQDEKYSLSCFRRVHFLLAHDSRSEEHTSELQSRLHLVCRLLLEKKNKLHKILNLLHSLDITYVELKIQQF